MRSSSVVLLALATACTSAQALDAGSPVDAAPLPDTDFCHSNDAASIAIVRPVAPLATARTTSRRPTFRWATTSSSPATLEICVDRACASVVDTVTTADDHAAPSADLPSGMLWWRVRVGSDVSTTWQVRIPRRSAGIDTSWGSTLDLDGDGYTDLATTQSWRLLVYSGGPSGVPDRPALALGPRSDPPVPGDTTFVGPADLGDVNGDGYVDLAATDYLGARALVLLGGAAGVSLDRTLALESSTHDISTIPSLIGLGDIDGDGYGDMLASVRYSYAPGDFALYVYRGGPAISECTGSAALTFHASEQPAGPVAAVGDVDGDGHADFVVETIVPGPAGTSGYTLGPTYVYRGGTPFDASAPTSIAPPTLPGPPNVVEPSITWAAAGDVNGDGYADAVLSWSLAARSVTPGMVAHALVYYGSASGLPSVASVTIDGPTETTDRVLEYAVGVGDLDADGYDDLVLEESTETQTTTVRICPGGVDGVDPARCLALDVAAVMGGVAGGDLDGDGYTDLSISIVLAPLGGISVFLGGAAGVMAPATTTLVGPYAGQRWGAGYFGPPVE